MPFVVPSILVQQYGPVSGRIPFDALVTGGTPGWRLWLPAARCHRAMMAAARTAGFDPRSTGTYRTYERQVSLFKERYSWTNTGVGRKFWPVSLGGDDHYWWKIQNPVTKKYPADAAVPGTSEHGWGCADDVAEELDGDAPVESISAAFHIWLTINARDYGFEQTNRSENWHWAYTLGGVIPPLVLIYEQPLPPPPPPPPPIVPPVAPKGKKMIYLVRAWNSTEVYATDGLQKWHYNPTQYQWAKNMSVFGFPFVFDGSTGGPLVVDPDVIDQLPLAGGT